MKSRRAFIHLLLLASALCLAGSVMASYAQEDDFALSEMEQRKQISEQARHLLRERKFAELETLAEDFRTNKTRFPSGLWKLCNFYGGLDHPGYNTSAQDWQMEFDMLNEWQSAFPKSATVRTALAGAYTSYAWRARGSDYANTVTEEGWRLFRQRLKQAEQIIDAAESESLYDPHMAFFHLVVGIGSNWPDRKYQRVFEDAVKREPCYTPYYFQRINWLMPRWNGQPGDCERFAQQAIALNENCEGKGIYARLAVYLMENRNRDKWFFDDYKLSWPTVHEGFEDLEKRYPNSLCNLNYYCIFACEAHDSETANRLFKRIGERWDGSVWGNEGQYRKWKGWAENPAAHSDYTVSKSEEEQPLWRHILRRLMEW